MDVELPALRLEIKKLIIETLQVPDVTPEEIEDDAPLFGNSRLNLDSIDALELFLALQRAYGVRIEGQNMARAVMESVTKIAEFVQLNRKDSQQEQPASI